MKEGSKYYSLFEHLSHRQEDEVTLTFTQIESQLKISLPPSARSSPGWWSNRSKGALQAAAWMGAGYHVTAVDLEQEQVIFGKPVLKYQVRREGDMVLWDGQLVKALRNHMDLTQAGLAQELGVRQQTVSQWETGSYTPGRAFSKYLTLVAEKAGFLYGET